MTGIVKEIQADIVTRRVPLAEIVRKARFTALKLDQTSFLQFIDREIQGYQLADQNFPEYRYVDVTPQALNPCHGWQKILFTNSVIENKFKRFPLGQSIYSVEGKSGQIGFVNYDANIESQLRESIGMSVQIRGLVNPASIIDLVEKFLDIILTWCVELEKKGIVGEDLSFSKTEIQEARKVTQNIFAQTIGIVGDVTSSNVDLKQNSSVALDRLDELVVNLCKSDDPAFGKKQDVVDMIKEIKKFLVQGDVQSAKKHGALVKEICLQASSSLLASGVIHVLSSILG